MIQKEDKIYLNSVFGKFAQRNNYISTDLSIFNKQRPYIMMVLNEVYRKMNLFNDSQKTLFHKIDLPKATTLFYYDNNLMLHAITLKS